MNRRQMIASAAAMAIATPAAAKGKRPQVIAHRGASGYAPEHTLHGYDLAITMGADHIEPDVVATKDGHLVVRHDPVLTDSTDILTHPEFADRKRTIDFGDFAITDYWVADFTLAEIKTLKARQVFADRDHSLDDRFDIPTLQEVIDRVQARSRETGRVIGLVPEIKFPTLHRQVGLAIEEKLVETLDRAGWNKATAPVWIQSFEQANLQALKKLTPVKLLQLVSGSDTDPLTGAVTLTPPDDKPYDWVVAGRTGSYADMLTPQGLDEVATYASVIAPWKRWLVSFKDGQPRVHQDIIDNAHARGLQVFTWTMRNDRLDPFYADPAQEYAQLFAMGIDGVFSDFADTAVAARNAYVRSR